MKPQGEAIIFAPTRGKTFEAFEASARSKFRVCRTERYDEDIWRTHQQVKAVSCEKLQYPVVTAGSF